MGFRHSNRYRKKQKENVTLKNISYRLMVTVWATILASYELGESLKAIAIDLDMPYETVRKYAQTVRKAIVTLEPQSNFRRLKHT
jgi:DNA-directed RNA polymerase specialized sigma24 family protein